MFFPSLQDIFSVLHDADPSPDHSLLLLWYSSSLIADKVERRRSWRCVLCHGHSHNGAINHVVFQLLRYIGFSFQLSYLHKLFTNTHKHVYTCMYKLREMISVYAKSHFLITRLLLLINQYMYYTWNTCCFQFYKLFSFLVRRHWNVEYLSSCQQS